MASTAAECEWRKENEWWMELYTEVSEWADEEEEEMWMSVHDEK
jgi:hypothetical protein